MPDNKRVLITGITGFVGRSLAPLLTNEYEVIGASRTPGETSWNLAEVSRIFALPDAKSAPDSAFADLVKNADHIVHLAAISRARGPHADDMKTANVLLVERLAKAARDCCSGRFVFLSSIYAQAGPGTSTPVTETSEPRPFGAYGQSKKAAEEALGTIFASVPERLVILRPAPIYGPELKGFLSLCARLAKTPFPLPIKGLGGKRSLVHVNDVSSASLLALSDDKLAGGTFLVAEPEPLDAAEIVAALRRGARRKPGTFPLPAMLADPLQRLAFMGKILGPLTADSSRLQGLGWQPRHQASDWLARERR